MKTGISSPSISSRLPSGCWNGEGVCMFRIVIRDMQVAGTTTDIPSTRPILPRLKHFPSRSHSRTPRDDSASALVPFDKLVHPSFDWATRSCVMTSSFGRYTRLGGMRDWQSARTAHQPPESRLSRDPTQARGSVQRQA
ncbi:hypothetical protein M3J09_000714 [Ascochyta lentis]